MWTNYPENLLETLDSAKRVWVVSPSCSDRLWCVWLWGLIFSFQVFVFTFFFFFLPALWITQGAICGAEITSDQTFSRFFSSLRVKTWWKDQISHYFWPHRLYSREGRVEVH